MTDISIELAMLIWAIILGLLHIVLAAMASTKERGIAWNLGARDGEAKPLGKIAGRLDRASKNFLETFAFFAAAILVIEATGRANDWSALGAQLYVWARLIYLPLYFLGVPGLRTLVWTVSLAGIVILLCVAGGGL